MSEVPKVRALGCEFRVLDMRTRMPFKYGIASLSALPHVFVQVDLEIGGRPARGLASEGLPPKWFTKNPETTFAADLADMLEVLRHAADSAVAAGTRESAFELWQHIHLHQVAWGRSRAFPGLLSGLGTALIERAVLDGLCRALEIPFARALRQNRFGIHLPEVHPELPPASPSDFLPEAPVPSISVRHTVGLADPLEDAEIPAGERLDDGLPQSLAASIRRYGLHAFKLKLSGHLDRDLDRLRHVARVLEEAGIRKPFWTLDGNEQFKSVAAFREFWDRFEADAALGEFRGGRLFVEQPLHRDVALSGAAATELLPWADRPPMIIDESDGEPGALVTALAQGYSGVSHKNCKGVFRGIANACLLEWRRRRAPERSLVLSSEDLANVGPVAMLQDLAVAACLGLRHSERNGHHYFRGLSMFAPDVQAAVLAAHADLYQASPLGFPTLAIRDGRIPTRGVLAAPFGCALQLDLARYTPLADWTPTSLDS